MHGPGHQFLAGARLSPDQDGSAILGENADHLVDLDHLGIPANHRRGSRVGFGVVGLFTVGRSLLHGGSVDLLIAQTAIYNSLEFLETHRLDEVVVGAGLHSLHRGRHGVVSGHDNHVDVLHGFPDPGQELQPRHPVHADIGDDQRWIESTDLGQRDLRTVSFVYFVTRILKLRSEHGSEVVVVVDQEDARHVVSLLRARF